MHANDIAFGIEIETHMPGHDRTPIGGYHNGLPVSWLPSGWKAERDGSIRTPAGRKPCEFVSPVLRGREGLQNVETAAPGSTNLAGCTSPFPGTATRRPWPD